MNPGWLPPELNLTGVSLDDDYEELYSVFERDFLLGAPIIVDGKTVITNTVPDRTLGGRYPYGFTHLVTSDDDLGGRTIDYDRARKLPWVRAVLENYTTPEVYAFYVKKTPATTLYLWLRDSDFVVILRRPLSKMEQKNDTRIIITAYDVNSRGAKSLQRLYGRSFKQL